jgi:hypothetical protein
MALRDDERRELAEIERWLVEDDPRLARQFTERPEPRALTGTLAAIVMMLSAGLVIMAVGVRLGAPLLVLIGGVVALAVPAVIRRS